MKKLLLKILGTTTSIFTTIFLMSLLLGVGQIIYYLRFGDWQSVSVLDLLVSLGLEWEKSPASWMGVFRILDWIPLSLFSGLGFIIFMFLRTVVDGKEFFSEDPSFHPTFDNIFTAVLVFYMCWFSYTRLSVSPPMKTGVNNFKEKNGESKVKLQSNGF
jgi:hypothetical protein